MFVVDFWGKYFKNAVETADPPGGILTADSICLESIPIR